MRTPIAILIAGTLATACGADTREPSQPARAEPPATMTDASPSSASPLPHMRKSTCAGIPDETEIRVEDTSRGAALVFITDDDIAALREQIAVRLASFSWADAHLDNVDSGIRIVFESAEGDRSDLRASVMKRGQELTRLCGLEWNIPADKPALKAATSASASPTTAAPSASASEVKPPPPAETDKKKTKDDAKKDKPAASAKPADTKPPPKPPAKPKDVQQPKPPPLPPPELPEPPPPPPPPAPPGPRRL